MSEVPTFEYEEKHWRAGKVLVAGVDEVGMGALAGPVCAGVVVFEAQMIKSKYQINDKIQVSKKMIVKDSKQLSEKQRSEAAEWIKENALSWSVGEATVEEIEQLNILGAARVAMRRAIELLSSQPEVLLIDGLPPVKSRDDNFLPGVLLPSEFIVGGDRISFSIAAASILAKVYRDEIMVKLSSIFPGYGWDSNKGYGSLKHRLALKELGATEHHRKTYAPVARCLT